MMLSGEGTGYGNVFHIGVRLLCLAFVRFLGLFLDTRLTN